MTFTLTDTEQHALRATAAWFLPTSTDYPSLADADPDDSVLNLVLQQLVPVQDDIRQALHALPDDDLPGYLEQLQTTNAEQFTTLRTLCLGWYFTCRPVWKTLGYTGRRAAPITLGEAEHHLRGGILDPVVQRGKIYRTT